MKTKTVWAQYYSTVVDIIKQGHDVMNNRH